MAITKMIMWDSIYLHAYAKMFMQTPFCLEKWATCGWRCRHMSKIIYNSLSNLYMYQLPDNPVLHCVNVLSKNRIAAIQKMMTWWHFVYVTFCILDMYIYTYVYVYIYNIYMYIYIYIYIECVYIHIDIPDTYTLLCKIQAFNWYIQ